MKFQQIVNELIDANVPARVSLTEDNEVILEMGRDYPDEISDLAWPILKKSGLKFSLCAEASGYKIKETTSIHGGGPRKKWPYRPDESYEY